nr:PQQ-binding-like beta-propeller repeat protein [bacterium]
LLATSGVMTCLDAKSGELIWEEEVDDSFMASPTLAGEWLYLFGEKGTMHRIKASRVFEISGTASLDGQILASPAFLDGRIIVRSDSNLYCLGNK